MNTHTETHQLETPTKIQKQLETARQHFQEQTFTDEQLARAIGEDRRTAVRRIKVWKKSNSIYEAGKDLYTFEPQKAIGTPLERAKQCFQQAPFTSQELAKELNVNLRTAQRYIKYWLEEAESIDLYRVPKTRELVAFNPNLKPSVTQEQGIDKTQRDLSVGCVMRS
ncbi:HTH domain-containing protein [Limnofasciculus baicalensis]|uniref:Helix-turn-helix domain-containing protein n=1 Tax=Limnofasciculus baicalensis BBK-W-15 TaxID=2699891 RepID=A0AAE3KR85_9CYAN|nr:HTH domain-containing protein [Limnofasciculus baicalensis]MCP2731413.1 helix-turn-helix domain-containing protein [Limnofasciculus baicalensis BBK-W-15]